MIEARAAWADEVRTVDPHRLVFLDESGVKTNMTRLYGWGLGGERVVDAAPHNHWQTTTVLAAIRVDGVIGPACLALPGAIDGPAFLDYVARMLAPQLRPGDIVVMDNLGSHKVKGVREAIEARGATVWYLPAYSPDLNPIEPMWSKVKALLRKLKARCQTRLYDALGEALHAVTAGDLLGFYRDAGYATSE